MRAGGGGWGGSKALLVSRIAFRQGGELGFVGGPGARSRLPYLLVRAVEEGEDALRPALAGHLRHLRPEARRGFGEERRGGAVAVEALLLGLGGEEDAAQDE